MSVINPFAVPAPEGKKARLFYYEDTVGAYVPVPFDVTARHLSCLNICVDEMPVGEVVSVQFQRFDLSDEEMEQLPEAPC